MGETDFSFFFSFMHRGGAERGPFITVKSAPIDEGQSFDDTFRQPHVGKSGEFLKYT